MYHPRTLLSIAFVLVATPACEPAPAAGGAATASAQGQGKKKLPDKKGATGDPTKGNKGGEGSKTVSPSSNKAAPKTISAAQKGKAAPPAQGDPCEGVPDGASECDGDHILVCSGGELYSLDCDDAMPALYPELFDGGTCYELEKVTDCLGVGVDEEGTWAACTGALDLCCDETGACLAH